MKTRLWHQRQSPIEKVQNRGLRWKYEQILKIFNTNRAITPLEVGIFQFCQKLWKGLGQEQKHDLGTKGDFPWKKFENNILKEIRSDVPFLVQMGRHREARCFNETMLSERLCWVIITGLKNYRTQFPILNAKVSDKPLKSKPFFIT